MALRWPACARVSATTPLSTIIVSQADDVQCRAHADGAAQAISFTSGAPGANGNGHPKDTAASHWGRCAVCDRLFIIVAAGGYRQVSSRIDVPIGADSFLDESDATQCWSEESTFNGSGSTWARQFPVVSISPLTGVIPVTARIIKAQVRAYANSVDVGLGVEAYRVLRADMVVTEATWNEYKAGSGWTTAGALGDDTDRDAAAKFQTAMALTPGSGWRTIIDDGATFRQMLADRFAETWAAAAYFAGTGVAEFKSVDAPADRPVLRLWWEAPPLRVAR